MGTMGHEDGRFSRRAVLVGGAAIMGAAAVPAGLWRALPVGALSRPYQRSTYTPLVGETMRMEAGGQQTHVVLSAVRDLTPVRIPDDQDRFALVFEPKAGTHPAGSDTYLFLHDKLGAVPLFTSPVGSSTHPAYEAVINRAF